MVKKYSLKEMVLAEENIQEKEELETHLHQKGRIGASNLGGCIILRAWRSAHLPEPKLEGLKADKSVFPLGHLLHSYIADKAKKNGTRNGYFVSDEILIEYPITNETIIESPIDVAIAKSPVFVPIQHQFRNQQIIMNKCIDPSKVEQIFDVKTCSDYTYWKSLREGANFHWKAQFEPYMRAMGLDSLTTFLYYKPKGWMSEIEVQKDDLIWQQVQIMQDRVEYLTDWIKHQIFPSLELMTSEDLIQNMTHIFDQSDFEYFGYDRSYPKLNKKGIMEAERPICWYSCPFSQTREEVDDDGCPKLILEKPCPWVCGYLKEDALAKFKVGQKWKRGLSHITILSIDMDTEIIECQNKSGTKYQDTLYYALDKYEVL